MNLFYIDVIEFQKFLLIFFRVAAILMVAPIFGSANVPILIKVGLSFILSILLFPAVEVKDLSPWTELLPLVLATIREILIGVVISFVVNLVFAGVQLGGQWAGFHMGFGIVNVIDPMSDLQVSIVAQFQVLVAFLVFLIVGAHHLFISALADSFRLIPLGGLHFSSRLVSQLVELTGGLFVIAVKIGAPILVLVFFSEVAMGLVARTVPQMNVFIVGYPIKIAIGLFMMGAAVPFTVLALKGEYKNLFFQVKTLMRVMGGG